MAHVLHTDGHHQDDCGHDGHDRGDRSGDFRDHDRSDCSGNHRGHDRSDCSGNHRGHDRSDCSDKCDDSSDRRRRRRRRRRHDDCLIPVGNISIDCSAVSFRTPGQARNVVTCAVSQTFNVPVTRTVLVQQPTDFGCFVCTPMTETVEVPVTATVNMPPVLVPVPRIVCPENVLSPSACVAPVNVRSCGCNR